MLGTLRYRIDELEKAHKEQQKELDDLNKKVKGTTTVVVVYMGLRNQITWHMSDFNPSLFLSINVKEM